MVIDESGMTEGKLGDMGVRNLRFLSRIVVGQKLGFEFPFHDFEIDTDLTVLVLGSSKSILPVLFPISTSPSVCLPAHFFPEHHFRRIIS